LIGSDILLVEDSWKGNNTLKVLLEGVDEGWLENVGSLACVIKIHVADVPSADDEVAWVYHWHEIFDWFENILELVGLLVVLVANMGGCALGEGPVEVGVLNTSLGFPRLSLFVGKNTGGEGRSVVSTKTDKHNSDLWNFRLGLKFVGDGLDSLGVGSLIPHWDFLLVGGLDNWSLVDLHFEW